MMIAVVTCLGFLPLIVGSMIGLAFLDVLLNKHEPSFAALGGGITAVLLGVSGFVGAIVALIWQDRKERAAQTVTTVTQVTSTPTATPAPTIEMPK